MEVIKHLQMLAKEGNCPPKYNYTRFLHGESFNLDLISNKNLFIKEIPIL
jgi:hypothetical protein